MRILDLGCGRAMSSLFLHREFGVEVWAWICEPLTSVATVYSRQPLLRNGS
jgi:hypothetical protein